MDRRAFLTNVAAAGAAVGLAPLSPAAAGTSAAPQGATAAAVAPSGTVAGAAQPAPQSVSRALLERARHARFRVAGHDRRRLVLTALHDGPASPALDQFSVTFRETEAGAKPLPSGSYSLEHVTHGPLRLHLEPITDGPGGVHYRATFCLLA
jgi:hypothetical protein